MELYASPNEGTPLFTNNDNFGLNEWSDPYYLTVTMKGEAGEVKVAEECTGILTDTDMFKLDSFTAADGTTYQTELYSPEQESDTMVVWLHGMGEGGNDIRMPLINVDMGALVSDPFQSIMGGAYVFVPQCPIYFIYAKNDPLVVPTVCEEPTISRLQAAGAEDLHVFAPDNVHDTTGRFVGEDGEPLQAFGHGSWQYFFNNDAVDEDGVNCWEWMAAHAK